MRSSRALTCAGGMPGHDTKTGIFSILEKQRFHRSNIYSGAPMPWMQRLTRSGTALHAGVVPGYPASHGCIRLPFSVAPKLFQTTTVGQTVVVANDRLTPKPIEDPKLFQPIRPPVALAMAHIERIPERRSRDVSDLVGQAAVLPSLSPRKAMRRSTFCPPQSWSLPPIPSGPRAETMAATLWPPRRYTSW
jgi:hypothetical protein